MDIKKSFTYRLLSQQLDLGSQAEVTLCPEPHINVDAIVRALLSRRRQTVLETVQHSSALLTRVHIATGALWLPDLAPVDSDDQRSLFQVLQLSPWVEEPRPEATSAFGLTRFQRHCLCRSANPFSVQISSRRLPAALEQASVRGVLSWGSARSWFNLCSRGAAVFCIQYVLDGLRERSCNIPRKEGSGEKVKAFVLHCPTVGSDSLVAIISAHAL